MNPLANPANTKGTHYYLAGMPEVDFAEKAELDGWDALRAREGKDANLNGFHIPVIKVDRPRPPSQQ
ncbi:MAG: hypothetical protein EPO52_17665 [Herbiconiux sp.]|uniref:hypothetical protein n=1 Tax=Herbiconiux sp. TaxID=1871186 RepID=UPI0011FFE8A3|nr:hypothetical protein [Herbiconiux sp.]TAJ46361.1 MAG: hypothetical protein EPO52_17665 [Herbiconiux sp.]